MGDIELMVTNISSKSAIYRRKVQQYLRDFDFKALFVNELGWNVLKESPLTLTVDGATYMLNTLAEKRGVKVFLCSPDASGQIPADSIARKIECEVTNHAAYEHFIIYGNGLSVITTNGRFHGSIAITKASLESC